MVDETRMIGDVNLFLKGPAEDPEFEVEVEIMIAGASLLRRCYLLPPLNASHTLRACLPTARPRASRTGDAAVVRNGAERACAASRSP